MDDTILLSGAVAAVIATLWQREAARRQRIRRAGNLLGHAMQRLRITPAMAESAGLERELERAHTRCSGCGHREDCVARLSALRFRGLPARCANAALFERIEQAQRPGAEVAARPC